jgi:hypothetical protein
MQPVAEEVALDAAPQLLAKLLQAMMLRKPELPGSTEESEAQVLALAEAEE